MAAGCGAPGPPRYDNAKSAACLRADNVRVTPPPRSDFVASTAINGAFRVHLPHNAVTVSFSTSEKTAGGLLNAYNTFHPKKISWWLPSVLYQTGNAVFLWNKQPGADERDTVDRCLKK